MLLDFGLVRWVDTDYWQKSSSVLKFKPGGGRIAQWLIALASRPAAPGFILGVPEFFSSKNFMLPRFIDTTLLREWTELSLIVDQSYLVMVSGKLVLQKN